MSQLYKFDEIKSHNGQNGTRTWIVLDDNVYDVTDYLKDHPGGEELIIDVAGRDATKEFDDSGHSSDAKQILKKYKIGELVEMDKKAMRKKKITLNTVDENGIDVMKRKKRYRFLFCSYNMSSTK